MALESKASLIMSFLKSDTFEDVKRGLEFIEALESETPTIINETLGEISVDNNGKLRYWATQADRDVWRLAPPINCIGKRTSFTVDNEPTHLNASHWLSNAQHQSYIGLWGLAKQAKKGQVLNAPFLDLTDCNLIELPDNIGALKNLIQIRLNDNHLENLPESFGNLKKLRVLDLERNAFRKLPLCLTRLKKLEDLNLNRNRLRMLPEEIKGLKRLENLSLWRNQLKKLPDSLGELSRLVHLGLEENKLSTLPESIGDLNQLVHLDLSHNPIKNIPDSIIGLYRIKTIVISKLEQDVIDQINSLLPEAHLGR